MSTLTTRGIIMLSLCDELKNILSISNEARSLGIFVAYTIASCSDMEIAGDPFGNEITDLFLKIKSKYSLEMLKNDPIVRAYRDFYWRIGIDPTKVRPSSEALVRRVLKGRFPRINPLVDAGNIASVLTLVPIGMYDLRKANPPFRIVISSGGEVFKPIGGAEEKLREGVPILIDSRGTVMHVYPHRDSVETMINEETRDVFIIGAGVPKVPTTLVKNAVGIVVKLLKKLGCTSCPEIIICK